MIPVNLLTLGTDCKWRYLYKVCEGSHVHMASDASTLIAHGLFWRIYTLKLHSKSPI